MSGYENILRAQQLLEGTGVRPDFYNKGNNLYNIDANTGVNPYTSRAYTDFNYRDLVNQSPDIIDDRQVYSDISSNLSKQDQLMLQGTKGLQAYQLGSQLSPYVGKVASGIYSGVTGSPVSGAGMQSFNLGPAAAVYSAFGTDNNPYTFTNREKYGGTASNLMAAHQLSKAIPALNAGSSMSIGAGGVNPYVMIAALAFSWWNNKRRKKKAKRLVQKEAKRIGDEQTKQYDERSKLIEGYRDDQLSKYNQQMHMDEQAKYSNQYGGNYSNRYQGAEGMKFSPQELNKIAKAGRNGDTMLAHINPQEAALLKSLGGSGTINPNTGLHEYGYGNPLSVISDTLNTGFDAIGDVLDPILSTTGDVVTSAGDVATDVVNTGVDLAGDTLDAAGNISTDVLSNVGDIITPVLEPVMDVATDITQPIMEGIHDVVEPIAAGATDIFGNVIEGGLKGVKTLGHDVLIPLAETILTPGMDILEGISDIFSGGDGGVPTLPTPENFKGYDDARDVLTKGSTDIKGADQISNIKGPNISGNKTKKDLTEGDWAGYKESDYLTENVLEETDYAAKGMKYKYYSGGKTNDIIAEFTGNELIVNDQAKVEKALEDGNYRAAAAPIRRAMNNNQVTPGPETHDGNPMPVDKDGNIYSKGGKLKFKVKKGAGVYDHATDQFKPTMTDKEIAMTAYNNMKKWESNGMA